MRGTLTLPDGYAGLCSIDLQKDKRLALLINGLALLIALPLVFWATGSCRCARCSVWTMASAFIFCAWVC
ncbi:MAG: hypothetical protein ACLRRT_00515 [Ruthenibacterium lactatiformans]